MRNHRGADNCWPQWANIFADEIERLWQIEDAARDYIANEVVLRQGERFWALADAVEEKPNG